MIGAASGCVTAALMGTVLRRLGRAYRAAGGRGKLGFVAALLVGACVSAACVILLKAFAKRNPLTSPLTMN